MRTSKTLARLRAGQPVRLCTLGHFIPAYICHAAHFGFDCIWLDDFNAGDYTEAVAASGPSQPSREGVRSRSRVGS